MCLRRNDRRASACPHPGGTFGTKSTRIRRGATGFTGRIAPRTTVSASEISGHRHMTVGRVQERFRPFGSVFMLERMPPSSVIAGHFAPWQSVPLRLPPRGSCHGAAVTEGVSLLPPGEGGTAGDGCGVLSHRTTDTFTVHCQLSLPGGEAAVAIRVPRLPLRGSCHGAAVTEGASLLPPGEGGFAAGKVGCGVLPIAPQTPSLSTVNCHCQVAQPPWQSVPQGSLREGAVTARP